MIAFAFAVLIHAGVGVILLWKAHDSGAVTAGPKVVRLSLSHAIGTPIGTATGVSLVPEAAMIVDTESAAKPAIEQAVSTEATETSIPVEPAEQAVVVEAPESGFALLDEAAVVLPVAAMSSKQVAAASLQAVTAVAEAVEPVRAIETPIRQAESPEIPRLSSVGIPEPDTEGSAVAETFLQAPAKDTASTPPVSVLPETVAIDTIQPEISAGLETATGLSPPEAVLVPVADIQPGKKQPTQQLQSSTDEELRGGIAGNFSIAPSPSGKGDPGQPTTRSIGPVARIQTASDSLAQQNYLKKVLWHITRFKRYPRAARRDGVVGNVMLRFTILADGRLHSPELTGSSGDPRLDRAALQMLSRASPFPPIPRSLGKEMVELSLPVQFSLDQKRSLF